MTLKKDVKINFLAHKLLLTYCCVGRRRLRFMLIGGAVALLGLTHLCSGPMQRYAVSLSLQSLFLA